jgi:uncharacterized repeat protein (TIGR02543 family)
MARKLYIGIGDKARRITKAYIGDPSSFYLTAENFCDHPGLINQGVTFNGISPSGGRCLYFNGSSRILIPSIADLGAANWTIDWREYPTVATTGSRFSSSYTTDSGACGGILFGYSNSKIYASNGADISNWNLVAGADMFSTTANTWTHWAVVKNGTSLKTYRNGTLYASTTCNGNVGISSKYYMALGDYRAGDHNYFTGYMDYFRISNYARWTGNFTAPSGKASGVARRVKKIYLGVNGVAKLVGETKDYKVHFNANGGSGSMSSLSTAGIFRSPGEGITYKIPACGFSRSGYIFLGWNTAANGSGTVYKDNSSITVTGDTTLYAIWIATITITYTKSRAVPDVSWASSYWDKGPMDCLTIEYWAPSICSTYGKSGWTIDAGRNFGDNQTLTVPAGGSIFVWCKNKYVSNTSFNTGPVYCDIYHNGPSVAYGNPASYTFSNINSNVYINAEWDSNGAAPMLGIGSSWWDITVNY